MDEAMMQLISAEINGTWYVVLTSPVEKYQTFIGCESKEVAADLIQLLSIREIYMQPSPEEYINATP